MNEPKTVRPSPPIVPLNGPSIRVSGVAVWFDGGAFSMNLLEQRPTMLEDGGLVPALHEVGRVILSPATLMYLRRNIDSALEEYRQAMGHEVPDPDRIASNLAIGNLLEDLTSTKE
jgi:hypothetical protein